MQQSPLPSDPPQARRLAWRLALLAPAAVLMATGIFFDPGSDLEKQLKSAAVTEAAMLAELPQPGRTLAALPVEENSEAFWLTRAPEAPSVSRVTWTAPVAAGDRIAVNFGAWRRTLLDVVSVADADPSATRIDTGPAGEPRFVLTCRKVDAPDAPLVQLTVDAEGRGITAIGTGAQSL